MLDPFGLGWTHGVAPDADALTLWVDAVVVMPPSDGATFDSDRQAAAMADLIA